MAELTNEEIVKAAMVDHDKHYWAMVQVLKRQKKGPHELADLIGEGSTVAHAIWEKYGNFDFHRRLQPAGTPEPKETNGWVSVESGLPKTTGVYGIYPPEQLDKDQGLNFSPRYFVANEGRNVYIGNKLAYGWVKDKKHIVTHWRELPSEPPKAIDK